MNLRTSKISVGLFILISLLAINVSAQKEGDPIPKPTPRCTSTVKYVYFVDSGTTVTEVRPGSNGGNGYQLDIEGTNVDKFEVVQEKYMTSVAVIPGYTNSTTAKWQIFFAPNMGREISTIRMKSSCGRAGIIDYKLTTKVTLLDK
jgi:hypothetical protein